MLILLTIMFGSASLYFYLAARVGDKCFRDATPEEREELNVKEEEIVKIFDLEGAGRYLFMMRILYYPAYPLIHLKRFLSGGQGRN